jgi:hypothetical protein
LEVRRIVGYLPKSVPLYSDMCVSQYLSYIGKLHQVDRLDFGSHADEPTATPLPGFIQMETSNLVSLKLTKPEQEDLLISKTADGN